MHDGPVDLVNIAAVLEGNALAVLFQKVGPEGWDLAGNVAASRKRLALAFGDLTLPFGSAGRSLDTLVPEPPRFEGPRFASIDAALAD